MKKRAINFLHRILHNTAASLSLGVASYRQPHRTNVLRRVLDLKRRRRMILTPLEANQLFSLVQSTAKLGGAMAEVGVYEGASARLIREADPERQLHLFDTFEGLPETQESDTAHHLGPYQKGEFACAFDNVSEYLSGSNHITIHKGLFPATAEAITGERFSFVHSDVDIYQSTKAVLEFFYPRMVPGGILITHDFVSAGGVNRAFVEFLSDKREPLIELPGDQGMIVKI